MVIPLPARSAVDWAGSFWVRFSGLGGAAAASGLDINAVVTGFATGGVSGAVTALVLGLIKAKLG